MGLKDMELLAGQNPGVNLGLNIAVMGAVGLVSYVGEIWKRLLFPVAYIALLTAVEVRVSLIASYAPLSFLETAGLLSFCHLRGCALPIPQPCPAGTLFPMFPYS